MTRASHPAESFFDSRTALVLRQDKEFGLEVVDLAKDPLAAGPLARSTTRNSNLDKALASGVDQIVIIHALFTAQPKELAFVMAGASGWAVND